MEMFAYHARKLVMKILCCFIPSKRARLALRSKFGFGESFAPLLDELIWHSSGA